MLLYVIKTVLADEKVVDGIVIEQTYHDITIAIVPDYLAPVVLAGIEMTPDVHQVDVFAAADFASKPPYLGETWVSAAKATFG